MDGNIIGLVAVTMALGIPMAAMYTFYRVTEAAHRMSAWRRWRAESPFRWSRSSRRWRARAGRAFC